MTALLTEREQFLKERQTRIGGTDIAALLQVHPNRGPVQVYLEKIGKAKAVEPNDQMKRGTRAEPYLAQTYTELTGRELAKCPTYRHPEYPECGVSPDYMTSDEALLVEIKSHEFFVSNQYGESGSDVFPQHEEAQCMWEMHITGIHQCELFVGFSWSDLRTYPIRYDREVALGMEEVARKFWRDNVLAGVEPDITGLAADTAYLKERMRKDSGATIKADYQTELLILELREAITNFNIAEMEKERLSNSIKKFMQDNQNAAILQWSGGKPITYKTDRDSVAETCDTAMLKAKAPEIYKQLKELGIIADRVTRKGARKLCPNFPKE